MCKYKKGGAPLIAIPLSDRDSYLSMGYGQMGYGSVAWCVCVSVPSERTAQLWVLLSRADRDRRADRSGVVLSNT